MGETRQFKVISPEGEMVGVNIVIPDNLQELHTAKQGPATERVKEEKNPGKPANVVVNRVFWKNVRDLSEGVHLIISETQGVTAALTSCTIYIYGYNSENQWGVLGTRYLPFRKLIKIPAWTTQKLVLISFKKIKGIFENCQAALIMIHCPDVHKYVCELNVNLSQAKGCSWGPTAGEKGAIEKRQAIRTAIYALGAFAILMLLVAGITLSALNWSKWFGGSSEKVAENALISWCNKAVREGSFDVAINYCDQALTAHPDNATAWNDKGAALFGLGKYNEALACFNNALAQMPNDPVIIVNKKNAEDQILLLQNATKSEAPVVSAPVPEPEFVPSSAENPRIVKDCLVGDEVQAYTCCLRLPVYQHTICRQTIRELTRLAAVEEKPAKKSEEVIVSEKEAELLVVGTDWLDLKNPAAGVKIIISELAGVSVSLDKVSCSFWDYDFNPDHKRDEKKEYTFYQKFEISSNVQQQILNVSFPGTWADMASTYQGFTLGFRGYDANKNKVFLYQQFYQWEREARLNAVKKQSEKEEGKVEKKPETPNLKPAEKKKVEEEPKKTKDHAENSPKKSVAKDLSKPKDSEPTKTQKPAEDKPAGNAEIISHNADGSTTYALSCPPGSKDCKFRVVPDDNAAKKEAVSQPPQPATPQGDPKVIVTSDSKEEPSKEFDEETMEMLAKGLKDDDYSNRQQTIRAFIEIGLPALKHIGWAALNDSDYSNRLVAIQALIQLGQPALKYIGKAALKDRGYSNRLVAIYGLVTFGEPALEYLGEASLGDSDYYNRLVAVMGLKKIGKKALKYLDEVATDDGDDTVRAAALKAIEEIGKDSILPEALPKKKKTTRYFDLTGKKPREIFPDPDTGMVDFTE